MRSSWPPDRPARPARTAQPDAPAPPGAGPSIMGPSITRTLIARPRHSPSSPRDHRDDGSAGGEEAFPGAGVDAVHHLGDVDPVQREAVPCREVGDEAVEFRGAPGEAAEVEAVVDDPPSRRGRRP